MVRECPRCGSTNISTETKRMDFGIQKFESCYDCIFRTATSSSAIGESRANVKGGNTAKKKLKAMRKRRRERLQFNQ